VGTGGMNIGERAGRGRITSNLVTAFGLVAIAVGALTAGGSAGAAPPTTGTGNPTCASLGFTGEGVHEVKNDPPSDTTIDGITFSYSDDQTVVTVTAAPGITILAVVIKAGDAFTLLTEPPFTGSAPLVGSGQVPQISHVLVCWTETPPPTTPPPTTAPPTTAPPTTAPPTTAPPTTAPPTTQPPTTQPPTTAAATTTTAVASAAPTTSPPQAGPTTTAVSPASAVLPATGRGSRSLLVAGTVLVLAGFGLRRLSRPTS
jgi:hypothetical protein